MSRQRILITGGTGVVGRPLVAALCAAGNEVVALCRRPPKDTASLSPNRTYLSGDVSQALLGLDADTYRDLRTVDTIFHLAARTDFKGASVADYEAININGVKNIYALAAEAGAHLHHISTAFVCGDHAGVFHEHDFDCGQGFRNGYEESKFRGEQFLRAQMVHQRAAGEPAVTIYRPSIILERQPSQASLNTFGPFIFLDGVFRILLAASRKNLSEETVRVRGDVTGSLPFIFDDNVVEALPRTSASPNTHGQTFHLLSARPCPNRMMEDVFNAAFGREAARLADAHAFQQRPATAAEKIMARKTAMYDSYLDLDVRFDRTRLEREHRFMEEREFREGLERPRAMDGVGVRKKDQPVFAGGSQIPNAFPHRRIGSEDVTPGMSELVRRGMTAEHTERPLDVGIRIDGTGFKFILAVEQAFHPRPRVRALRRQQTRQ